MIAKRNATQRRAPRQAPVRRTSDLLRDILARNLDTEEFTIGGILDSLGSERAEASLILFSVPSVMPIHDAPVFCGAAACAVGDHYVAGSKEFRLPKSILEKKVPRRSLAVAIHAVLPLLEFAEKNVQPRLAWVSHPVCRRIVGLLLFVLAATIAFPVIGFDPLHALSIFVMSLGLAEQDGVAILLGASIGVLSLTLFAATAFKLHRKIGSWLRRFARRIGFNALAAFCEKRGWKRLASILRLEWSYLPLLWNPEQTKPEKRPRTAPKTLSAPAGTRRAARSGGLVRMRETTPQAERVPVQARG